MGSEDAQGGMIFVDRQPWTGPQSGPLLASAIRGYLGETLVTYAHVQAFRLAPESHAMITSRPLPQLAVRVFSRVLPGHRIVALCRENALAQSHNAP